MAKFKRVCTRCGTPFETDSVRRIYCYGSCSYDAILERRPIHNENYQRKKERERAKRNLHSISPLAAFNHEAREAGMTYGQYESWRWCQEEIAQRQEERRRGIRFFDKYLDILGGM